MYNFVNANVLRLHRGKPANPSDKCRVCECDFKIKFGTCAERPGKDGYKSSENLFVASKRKECYGVILADIC